MKDNHVHMRISNPGPCKLILTTDLYVWYDIYGGCNRSAGGAYSSMTPDPTFDIFRDLCTPVLWFVFPIGLIWLLFVIFSISFIVWCSNCRFIPVNLNVLKMLVEFKILISFLKKFSCRPDENMKETVWKCS
jgi:hypothetical protein